MTSSSEIEKEMDEKATALVNGRSHDDRSRLRDDIARALKAEFERGREAGIKESAAMTDGNQPLIMTPKQITELRRLCEGKK